MKFLGFGVVAVFLSVPVLAQSPAPSATAAAETDAERAVRAARQQVIEAGRTKDRAAFERLLAEEFTFVHSTGGRETRAQFIDNNVAGATIAQGSDFETLDEKIRVYDDRFAVWMSSSVARMRGTGRENRLRSTNLFIKRDGRWLYLSGQSTRLPSRPKAVAVEAAVLDGYVGEYTVPPARTLTIRKDGDALRVALAGFSEAELVPHSATEFVWFNPESNLYSELHFVKDAAGRATHAIWVREGEEVWRAPKVK